MGKYGDHYSKECRERKTPAEVAAGVEVASELNWHDVGCVKRYGAESPEPCECEKRLAPRTSGD